MKHNNFPKIPLPRGWSNCVKSAMLHILSLAHFTITYIRSWAIDSRITRIRLQAENDLLRQQVSLLTEEIRIKESCMNRIIPHKRPHYESIERMAILELRAARGWSIKQTANVFQVTEATISSWMKRIDNEGPNALVQIRQPVNKFPEFVRYTVQRLKVLSPSLVKVKIADMLCRAGLHLGTTTVGRILKESPTPKHTEIRSSNGRVVTAKSPNHIWHIDLTAVPVGGGFWVSWMPFSLPQCWPFCWWVAVVVDHYSRRVMGFSVFPKKIDSPEIQAFLESVIDHAKTPPKYLISDKDSIFWCKSFNQWCTQKEIRPRYGAIGKHGSIAIVERLIRTMKDEFTRRILVALSKIIFHCELDHYIRYYNEHRPHTSYNGKTPNEVYFKLRPANQRPRIEPRKHWPRRSRCSRPQTLIAGQPGDWFTMEVDFINGRRHLPIVLLKRAA